MNIRFKLTGCYLSKKQQLKVLNKALEKIDSLQGCGLCYILCKVIEDLYLPDYLSYGNIREYLPYFTRYNIEYYGNGHTDRAYYWEISDIKSRIEFILWMREQTKKK